MMKEVLQKEWSDGSIITPSNQNEQFESHGNKLKIIIPTTLSNNQFGLYNIEMTPKARGSKLNYHKLMSETFIIKAGTLTVLTAKGEVKAETGTVVHLQKFPVHGYNNDSDNIVKMTMIFNPGLNSEDFFRKMYKMLDEVPNNIEAFQKLYQENDSYWLNEKNMIPMVDQK
jgi:quercetin dioxygenase-like cupin family protein